MRLIRIFFLLIFVLILGYGLLRGNNANKRSELPIFIGKDKIALENSADLQVTVHSRYVPDSLQLEQLKNDYNSLWGHLNYLYATNDITAGKEYFTEPWFKQMALHYEGVTDPIVTRQDKNHELHIMNWASDGLVYTAIDSNVVLDYHYLNGSRISAKANLALVMLFQGDHWRIDALKVLSVVSE